MRMSASDAAFFRKAGMGPAAMAAQRTMGAYSADAQFMRRGGSLGLVSWPAAPVLLGSLGDGTPIAATAAETGITIASKTGGFTALASWAGAGSWAGPIGAAAGIVLGLVAAKVLAKNYLNVGDINKKQQQELQIFQQYQQVAGTFAGRQVGLDVMRMVWKGSEHVGWFNRVGGPQCFHKGCFQYPGRGDWIDTTLDRGDADYQLPKAWKNMQAAATVAAAPPTSARYAYSRAQTRGFRGFGAFGAGSGPPEAVTLVDQYMLPAAAREDRVNWESPSTAAEHQLLYDVADAWIYERGGMAGNNSTPFIARPTTMPAQTTVTAADPTQGGVPGVGPGPGGTGTTSNTVQLQPVKQPDGTTVYVPTPVTYPTTTGQPPGQPPAYPVTQPSPWNVGQPGAPPGGPGMPPPGGQPVQPTMMPTAAAGGADWLKMAALAVGVLTLMR